LFQLFASAVVAPSVPALPVSGIAIVAKQRALEIEEFRRMDREHCPQLLYTFEANKIVMYPKPKRGETFVIYRLPPRHIGAEEARSL
jgi:hypothetical protein